MVWFSISFAAGCASSLATPPQETLRAAAPVVTAVTERITYISVVFGQRRVVYTRSFDVPPSAGSDTAPVFEYYESDGHALSVLTSEGLCQTTEGRSFRVTLNCGRRSGAWTGFELNGCVFPEAGPLVVFQGHEPLRIQSLVELPAASGREARAFEARVRGGASSPLEETNDSLRESASMQREMEAMQRAQAGLPPLPPRPPAPAARLGTVRTAFGIWMVDALNGRGVPLMVTRTPHANLRLHRGSQWHTLVAGPRDTDYAYLIGTHSYSWPIVVPVRQGTWPPPRYRTGPPFGWIGPAMCADL